MTARFRMLGALLAAPLLAQVSTLAEPAVGKGKLVWFTLTETREQVAHVLGAPAEVAAFGPDFVSWKYRVGDHEEEEYSHYLVFRKSDGKLLSATRKYAASRNVDALFPESATTSHEFRGENNVRYSVRVRKLDSGRLLLAMGTAKPGDPTQEIVLIRATELPHFHPWLAEQLAH